MFSIKKFTNKIAAIVTILSCLITPANALDFTFDYGNNFGAGGYKKGIVYTLLAALNVSNPNPRTASIGSDVTQVATSSVVVQKNTGVLVTLPAGYPAIEGAKYSWDTADGAVLGTDLVDTINTAAAWGVSGTNTVADDGGMVKVTYVDNQTGAAASFSAAAGLSSNLTVGLTYRVSGLAKVSSGAIVNIRIGTSTSTEFATITSTTNIAFTTTFVATAVATNYIGLIGMAAGEIIWLSGISVREITPALLAPSEATATVLGSGMTRYTGNTYGQPGLGVLAEPSLTNKVTCQKANPTVTTNITKVGDEASVLSIVDDTAALTAAGLIGICTLGDVYKLDNSAGVLIADANIAGATANTNKHTGSAYVRASAGAGVVRSDLSTISVAFSNAAYERVIGANFTPSSNSAILTIRANAGAVVYFILPQLEEYPVATSPIFAVPETTAAVTRASRYTTIAGSELGTDWHVDANVKNLGTEMALIGDPTSLAMLYKNAADKVVWRGVSLGADLVDTMNTVAAWTGDGTNTVADDAGAVKVTYVDNSLGALSWLRGTSGISSNLTVGKTYKITGQMKVNAGASAVFVVNNGTASTGVLTTSSTTYVPFSHIFRAASATDCYCRVSDMGTGEIAWVNLLVITEVKELTSTSSLSANTPAIIGVHQGTDGASLYINGTAEATDATMTDEVSWGTTVRLGADTAATAGNVLNGSISLVHSSNDERLFETSQIIELPNYENIVYLADRRKKIKIPEYERKAA